MLSKHPLLSLAAVFLAGVAGTAKADLPAAHNYRSFNGSHFQNKQQFYGDLALELANNLQAVKGLPLETKGRVEVKIDSLTCSGSGDQDTCKIDGDYNQPALEKAPVLAKLVHFMKDHTKMFEGKNETPYPLMLPASISCSNNSIHTDFYCYLSFDLGYLTQTYVVDSTTTPAVNDLLAQVPDSLVQKAPGSADKVTLITHMRNDHSGGGRDTPRTWTTLYSNSRFALANDYTKFSNALGAVLARRPERVLPSYGGLDSSFSCVTPASGAASICVVTETGYDPSNLH